MGFCYEINTGCCGCPVRNLVCTALCHFMLHGLLVLTFALTNVCYPPLGFVDYLFGGSGLALMLSSFITAFLVDTNRIQFLRVFMTLIVVLAVLFCASASFYYAIQRWEDVMVTALTTSLRKPDARDFPDWLWFSVTVICCSVTPIFLTYLIYILSFMCNRWKSHLFETGYRNDLTFSPIAPPLSIPADTYSSKDYKPYPVQRMK